MRSPCWDTKKSNEPRPVRGLCAQREDSVRSEWYAFRLGRAEVVSVMHVARAKKFLDASAKLLQLAAKNRTIKPLYFF